MPRFAALLFILFGLSACAVPGDVDGPPAELGDFRLGHNVVVAPNLVKGPASREASREEWIAAMTSAVEARFDRYEGGGLYHLGISVEGYVLAAPGVPVLAAPKSVLILKVTVWDDAAGRKLTPKPRQFTILEPLTGDAVVGSGLTQTKQEQMQVLSRAAVRRIESWLEERHAEEGWFTVREPAGGSGATGAQEPIESAEQDAPPGAS